MLSAMILIVDILLRRAFSDKPTMRLVGSLISLRGGGIRSAATRKRTSGVSRSIRVC